MVGIISPDPKDIDCSNKVILYDECESFNPGCGRFGFRRRINDGRRGNREHVSVTGRESLRTPRPSRFNG